MEARGGQAERSAGAYARLGAAVAAVVAAAAAAVLVATLVRDLPPVVSTSSSTPASAGSATTATSTTASPASSGSTSPSTSVPGFPAPPSGAVVLAQQAGEDALGLAVKPAGKGVLLQASIVKPFPKPPPPKTVRFEVTAANGRTTTTAAATPCGAGCWRATSPVARPRHVTVVLEPHTPSRVGFGLPAAWPPKSGAALVAKAAKTWFGLRTLVIDDRLGDGHTTLDTVWKIVAPDRIEYLISDGDESIIIGDRRWVKPAGSTRWIESAQTPVQQPQPFWETATDARILGTVSVNGRPAWKISFFDPRTPGWFTILVDKATMHTVDMHMTALAHFMHDTYSSFDGPVSVTPPTR
jgi:hypothetical protein